MAKWRKPELQGVEGVVQRLPSRFLAPTLTCEQSADSFREFVSDLESWLASESISIHTREVLEAIGLLPAVWFLETNKNRGK